jgi:hypothetical protein
MFGLHVSYSLKAYAYEASFLTKTQNGAYDARFLEEISVAAYDASFFQKL